MACPIVIFAVLDMIALSFMTEKTFTPPKETSMTAAGKNRLPPQRVQDDIDAYLAIKVIPDWNPIKPEYAVDAITRAHDALRAAQEAELHAQHTLDAARDALVSQQWDFHSIILGAKDQARAMFGPDSDHVAALGLKKKSDKKSPSRGPKPKPTE